MLVMTLISSKRMMDISSLTATRTTVAVTQSLVQTDNDVVITANGMGKSSEIVRITAWR
jgi:hypothetical protein